ERTKALFAGLAAHSFLSLDQPLTAAFGLLLGAAAHAVGWPIPRAGSQAITSALCGLLSKLGGTSATSRRIVSLEELPGYDFILCDVTPGQLLKLEKEGLSPGYSRQLSKYRYGPAVFKVDYALDRPIPWTARECLRAVTVHLGGSFDEIAASEKAVSLGQHAERPMVLVAQPSLFDPTRDPGGRHKACVYCQFPNGLEYTMIF